MTSTGKRAARRTYASHNPSATAAALPPELPPALRSLLNGFSVRPQRLLAVSKAIPDWGIVVFAKMIAPASYGALLQLPKEQLRELADKQPALKAGLREYVMKKAGNKARVAGLLDIFAENDTDVKEAPANVSDDAMHVDGTPPPA